MLSQTTDYPRIQPADVILASSKKQTLSFPQAMTSPSSNSQFNGSPNDSDCLTASQFNRCQPAQSFAGRPDISLARSMSSSTQLIPFPQITSDVRPVSRPSSAVTSSSDVTMDHDNLTRGGTLDAPLAKPDARAYGFHTDLGSSLSESPAGFVISSNSSSTLQSMPPPPVPITVSSAQHITSPSATLTSDSSEKAHFVDSLRQVPTLYNLPRSELEDLVAHVIREEGFTKLVSIRLFYFPGLISKIISLRLWMECGR